MINSVALWLHFALFSLYSPQSIGCANESTRKQLTFFLRKKFDKKSVHRSHVTVTFHQNGTRPSINKYLELSK